MVRSFEAENEKVAIRYAMQVLNVGKKRVVEAIAKTKRGKSGTTVVTMKVKSKIETMVIDFVEHVLSYMGYPIVEEFVTHDDSGRLWIQLAVDNPSMLIGHRGKVLYAIQLLVNTYAQRHTDKDLRIILDVKQYRERRLRTIEQQVRRAVKSAREGTGTEALHPMNSFERHYVHEYVRSISGVETESEGEGKDRYVRIIINDDDEH